MRYPHISQRAAWLALLAFVPLHANLHAQLQPGLTASLVSSTMTSPGEKVDRRTGFAFGATLNFPLASGFSFVTGATYAQKGAAATDKELGMKANVDLAYLQIPALVRYRFGNGRVRPYVEGGGAFATRLSCRLKASAQDFEMATDCNAAVSEDESTSDPLKKTDMSLLAGAGVDFGKWTAGLSWDQGLTNLDRSGAGTSKNRALLASVTYWFGR